MGAGRDGLTTLGGPNSKQPNGQLVSRHGNCKHRFWPSRWQTEGPITEENLR
jgi:hypothetical protein